MSLRWELSTMCVISSDLGSRDRLRCFSVGSKGLRSKGLELPLVRGIFEVAIP